MHDVSILPSPDNAYNLDPRIIKFKEEEKERRNAQKRAKQEAARMRVEEEERVRGWTEGGRGERMSEKK